GGGLRRRPPRAGGVRAVGLVVLADALDDDLVLLHEDFDRAVAGPVLGVDRVVLDGGVEPQAVALLAVVEGPFERPGAARRRAAAAPAAAPATAGGTLLVLLVLALRGTGALGLLTSPLGLLAGALGLQRGGLELGGDQRVVLG